MSKFDVADGMSKVWHVDTPVTEIRGLDTAFVRTDDRDAQALDITVVNPDGTASPRDLEVGERIKIIGRYRVSGSAHDDYGASLSLPEGMKIVETEGVPATVEGRVVRAEFAERRAPEQVERIVVIAEVEEPFSHSGVDLSARSETFASSSDRNPDNDYLSVKIRALGDRREPGDMTRSMELFAMLVIGLVVGAGAVAATGAWRRRSRA